MAAAIAGAGRARGRPEVAAVAGAGRARGRPGRARALADGDEEHAGAALSRGARMYKGTIAQKGSPALPGCDR